MNFLLANTLSEGSHHSRNRSAYTSESKTPIKAYNQRKSYYSQLLGLLSLITLGSTHPRLEALPIKRSQYSRYLTCIFEISCQRENQIEVARFSLVL